MFKAKNFCHIASNNRNNVKVGVFTYRTTDDLATVLVSGYFNERIIDINLHDLIIHEKIDATDNTKVERNLLCVVQRTLDNVGTAVIKSKWEGDIEQAIADLQTYVDNTFVKIDGTSVMTGPLLMRATANFKCAIAPYWDGVGFFKLNDNDSVSLMASLEYEDGLTPATDNQYNLGTATKRWKDARIARVITATLNNGFDIAVPITNSADTLALKSQVDDAANSGEQLYTTGVWYAKMYAATVVPTGAEYDGRNYADFSQVDGDNNPVIKIYTGVSGAWSLTETITPPANYNGYMTITSKIWDISEQAGQQGGLVLWSHNQKTFTPYPRIVSFEDAALTGTPTTPTPDASSPSNQIANKDYVDTELVRTSGKSIDADIVGTLTIASNGDVSGFSLNDYLKLPADIDFSTSTFEIDCAFTATNISSAVFALGRHTIYGITIWKNLNDDKIQAEINTQTLTGTTSLLANTKYFVKLTSDGVNYTLSLSTDGTNYVQEATAAISDTPKLDDYRLGMSSPDATLHMSNYRIKQNGIVVWNGLDAAGLHQRLAKGHAVGFCSFNTATRVQITTTDQTAAKNGWLIGHIDFSGSNKNVTIYVNSIDVVICGWSTGAQWFSAPVCLPIKAGQTYRFLCTGTVETNKMYFYPDD